MRFSLTSRYSCQHSLLYGIHNGLLLLLLLPYIAPLPTVSSIASVYSLAPVIFGAESLD